MWILIQTKPHGERRAQFHVERTGCRTYLPEFLPQRTSIRIPKPQALYPGYLFTLLPGEEWYFLKGTIGVNRILMSNTRPAEISIELIDKIKSMTSSQGYIELPKREELFKPGQKVRPASGPLSGVVGLYQGMTGKQRVEVLFGSLKVQMDESQLEAA